MTTIMLNITHGFQARMLLRSGIEERLVERGCKMVVVSPNGDEPYFRDEFRARGFEVETISTEYSLVEKAVTNTRSYFLMNPSLGDTMNYKRERYKRDYPLRYYTTRIGNIVLGRIPALRKTYLAAEHRLFQGQEFDSILDKHKPDLVVSGTPGFSVQDAHILRAAKRKGIPTTTVMLSWDNLTSKGYMSAQPDSLLTWSQLMKQEAHRYHDFAGPVHEVGAAQFDIYKDFAKGRSKADLKAELGVPPDRPLIVWGTINSQIYLGQIKVLEQYLKDLQELDPKPYVWVRMHPQTVFGPFEHLKAEYEKLDSDDVTMEFPKVKSTTLKWDLPKKDMNHLALLMFAADVMVTPQSTLTIDAACANTPIINLAIDESFKKTFDYTHYRNIIKHDAVWLASSQRDLVKATESYVANPTLHEKGRQQVVLEQLGVHLGQAATRSADVLYALATKTPINASHPPLHNHVSEGTKAS